MTEIERIHQQQQIFWRSGKTREYGFRKEMLCRLNRALHKYEPAFTAAIWADLHKSYEEAYLTELSIVYAEIRIHLRHLRRWMRAGHKPTPLSMFPAKSRIVKEPLGNALIIAPWNYPIHLLLNPLVGAISSGCTAMLKSSPYTPHVSAVLTEMIRSTFSEEYIGIVEGHREVNTALLARRWDIIFFTGSPDLGKVVMQAAAQHLTPVVLELGGKSPCIIDRDADLAVAARRVAWGKALNAGQTCIAPDYLLIHKDIQTEFLRLLKQEFTALLGENPQENKHYVHIVSDKSFNRLKGYLHDGTVYFGGITDATDRYFSPTILTDVHPDSPVMQEEIFGPIFPVLTFNDLQEVLDFIGMREKPLALYYFGRQGRRILQNTSAGGTCINDTIMHIVNPRLPFGGVGNSGMGSYHGKQSFLAFTHQRAVVSTATCIDLPFRYMPYKLFKWIKEVL